MNEHDPLPAVVTPSRAPRLVPPWSVWGPIAFLAGAIVLLQTTDISGHPGLDNSICVLLGLIIFLVAFIWFCFRSNHPKVLRWGLCGVVVVGLCAFLGYFDLDGFSGNMIPKWRPRAVPKPDRLLAQPANAGGTVDLATTTSDDFAQFLGPQRDLVLNDVMLDPDWSTPPELVWRKPIGAAWSAFAVVNGYAVTMEQRGDQELITCYEAATGKPRWSYANPTRYETVLGGVGPRATPTIHGGRVYALGGTGWLVCLDGASGKLLWKRNLLTEFDKPVSEESVDLPFGRSNSPLILPATPGAAKGSGKGLVVVPGGGPAGKRVSLAAFSADTGSLVWKAGTHHIGYSSPVLATVAGREQILNVTESHVLGHDPMTGKVLWEFEWEGHSNTDATNSQAVVVGPDKIFVSRGYGGGVAVFQLIPKDDGTFSTKLVYRSRSVLRTKFTNVALKDGYIYGLSEGTLECIKADTGKRVWKNGRYDHGQILLAGKHLLVLAEQGDLYLVEASPERANQVLGEFRALEGKTWNNLALYGDLLLVRNAEEAACYRLKRLE